MCNCYMRCLLKFERAFNDSNKYETKFREPLFVIYSMNKIYNLYLNF